MRRLTVGERFGRLTLLDEHNGKTLHDLSCRCDCGNVLLRRAGDLGRGHSTSCGCGKRLINLRHGNARGKNLRSPEYGIWVGIIARCENEKSSSYPRYGGRGIRICERWRADFVAFLADMGARPSPAHSIDRIDSKGHYEPGNCRWTTHDVQSRNRWTTQWVEHNGERLCVTDWAKRVGLKPATVRKRLLGGWSVERALSTPVGEVADAR